MSSGDSNSFSSVVGVWGSVISIVGLLGLLRYRAHLPEVHITRLDDILNELEEGGFCDDLEINSATRAALQQLSMQQPSLCTLTDKMRCQSPFVKKQVQGCERSCLWTVASVESLCSRFILEDRCCH